MLKSVLVVAFALFAVCFGDGCITMPPSILAGKSCSPASTSCQSGYYCSNRGICEALATAGTACSTQYQNGNSVNMCATGSTCKGVMGSQICVAYASPSEPCSTNSSSTIPSCAPNLYCNPSTGLCTGGLTGDKCYNSSDCAAGANCTNQACDFVPDSGACGSGVPCKVTSYCKSGFCTPLLTAGVPCTVGSCVDGTVCVGKSSLDTPVCVANQTRNPGEFCDQYDSLCIGSNKCVNSYCAKTAPDQCYMNSFGDVSSGNCQPNSICLCGNSLGYGTGNCKPNPCYSLLQALDACLWPVCGFKASVNPTTFYQGLQYSGSCVNRNCQTAATAFIACSPASSVSFSLALIAFSLFFSFFSKHF